MSNGRVCANANCHHTEDQHVSDMCWGKPKEIRKDGPTPGCRCNGFVARRDTTVLSTEQLEVRITTGGHSMPSGLMWPKTEQKRWRFVSDDDGHDYLIPAEKVKQFNTWLGVSPYWEEYDGEHFDQYRVRTYPNNYTFTDPKEDK